MSIVNTKFSVGDSCGIRGSDIIHIIYDLLFDGKNIYYKLDNGKTVIELDCFTVSELRELQIERANALYAKSERMLEKIQSLIDEL